MIFQPGVGGGGGGVTIQKGSVMAGMDGNTGVTLEKPAQLLIAYANGYQPVALYPGCKAKIIKETGDGYGEISFESNGQDISFTGGYRRYCNYTAYFFS